MQEKKQKKAARAKNPNSHSTRKKEKLKKLP